MLKLDNPDKYNMKPRFVHLAVLFFMLLTFSASAQNHGKYEVTGGAVYYDGIEVRHADPVTFKVLGYGYAKDRNHVYSEGKVLPYVDPEPFRVSGNFALQDRPGPERPGGPSGHRGERPDVVRADHDVHTELYIRHPNRS